MALRIRDLHTFHVVARTGAMKEAAEELGVTPGAISQRIRAVEERHGARLFLRSRKGIELTEAGKALWNEVSEAFEKIEAAHQRHFAHQPGRIIRINAAPTFAYSFLVPRLGAFTSAHPEIRITIETDERLVDLRNEPVDLAIRHGLGTYAGLRSEWISSPELIVVASPLLLEKNGSIDNPIDCLTLPLLQNAKTADWPLWFQAQGIDAKNANYSTAFGDDLLIVKAALEGQGLALLNDVYVKDALGEGTLVKVLNSTWPTQFAYYAVTTPTTFDRPVIRGFIRWLQAGGSSAGN